jgi:FtsZ-interacting cell division protein ZipA
VDIIEAIASVPRAIWGWVVANPILVGALVVALILAAAFWDNRRRQAEMRVRPVLTDEQLEILHMDDPDRS